MEIEDLGLRIGHGDGLKDEGGVMGKREGGQGTGTGYSGGLSSLPSLASEAARPGQLPAVLPLLIATPDSKWTRCSLRKAT